MPAYLKLVYFLFGQYQHNILALKFTSKELTLSLSLSRVSEQGIQQKVNI